ncbi:unnamed protein product [Darwinula stevensoni]|uniref:J domain-containing protein n=1 Tax=Darwinula stevensoni TaxID=69355 RepID=A0A7R9FQ91_9CRUS|nr:unnamed protein product [Darwinula stevensoni]CAG0899335.1 unnamed protein product [Darwinula stevensoni]
MKRWNCEDIDRRRMAGFKGILQPLYSICFCLLTLDFDGGDCSKAEDAAKHIELGKQFLSRGAFQDALDQFHYAIDADPENYMSYYRRATVYLALGRAKSALPDLDKVIQLKPDFTAARVQRGSVHMKMGHLDEAHIDLEVVLLGFISWVNHDSLQLRKEPDNAGAGADYAKIEEMRHAYEEAYALAEDRDCAGAIPIITYLLESATWDIALRELRAECYLEMGDVMNGISDLRSTVKLTPDNTAGHLKLAQLHYNLGEAPESLQSIRECLKLDPDHEACFSHYKKVKKLAKLIEDLQSARNEGRHDDCILVARKVVEKEPRVKMFVYHGTEAECHCGRHASEPDLGATLKACDRALEIREEPHLLCDRAEAHIDSQDFDAAIRDFEKALELDEGNRQARDGVGKAKRLKKQAGKRDYYKILGVDRRTEKKDIIKAYRKLAQKYHPDNFPDETEKKEAEKKFLDIAAAKEVLTDPEMRAKYDNGEDPLDPETQAGQNFNPFQHFHFQGQPFTFKFHFN